MSDMCKCGKDSATTHVCTVVEMQVFPPSGSVTCPFVWSLYTPPFRFVFARRLGAASPGGE